MVNNKTVDSVMHLSIIRESCFVNRMEHKAVFGCGVIQVNFTHVLQSYHTGSEAIIWLSQY